jgi:hypothetical protein
MERTRKPLRDWFAAMYLFVVSKQGISAMDLSRQVGVSYPTAWTWLHKLRSAVNDRDKSPLGGVVEVDETWEGGLRQGEPERPTVRDARVVGAVEVKDVGWGRVRLELLENGSSTSIGPFLQENVAAGSTLLSENRQEYRDLTRDLGMDHVPAHLSGGEGEAQEAHPAVHRVFSLLHRVLLTTYQGAVSRKHLSNYLAEYEFRFNRRSSASRTLLFQRLLSCAVRRPPPCYWQILGRPDGKTPLWAGA